VSPGLQCSIHYTITLHPPYVLFPVAAGQVTVKSAPKLDYFTKHQTIDTISPAIDLHVFSMELEGTFVVMANNNPEARARWVAQVAIRR